MDLAGNQNNVTGVCMKRTTRLTLVSPAQINAIRLAKQKIETGRNEILQQWHRACLESYGATLECLTLFISWLVI